MVEEWCCMLEIINYPTVNISVSGATHCTIYQNIVLLIVKYLPRVQSFPGYLDTHAQ